MAVGCTGSSCATHRRAASEPRAHRDSRYSVQLFYSMMEAATLVSAFNDHALWKCVMQVAIAALPAPAVVSCARFPLPVFAPLSCQWQPSQPPVCPEFNNVSPPAAFLSDASCLCRRSWNMQLAVADGIERPAWLSGKARITVPWIKSFRGGLADRRVHDLILNVPVHRLISVIQGDGRDDLL